MRRMQVRVRSLGNARVRLPKAPSTRGRKQTGFAAVTQHVQALAKLDSQTLAELISTGYARTLMGGFKVLDEVPGSKLLMRFDDVSEARCRALTEREYRAFLSGDIDSVDRGATERNKDKD